MGQYYKTVNLDKRQALNPHQYGDGLKLMEFGMSGQGTLTALAAMLVLNEQGQGPWAGDRIVVAGDYADNGNHLPESMQEFNLYGVACGHHLEEEDEEKGPAVYPAPFDKPFEFIEADKATEELKSWGLEVTLGSTNDRVIEGLRDFARAVPQPEDLFELFGVMPCEPLIRAWEWILREIRCSTHASDVSWFQTQNVALDIDETTGEANSVTVTYLNARDGTGKKVTRTLNFPATVADVREFFNITEKKPQK